jgi:phosphotransacetylase
MTLHYQGSQNGNAAAFKVIVVQDNATVKGSCYQLQLQLEGQMLPIFKSDFYKSIAECVKDVQLFAQFNHIKMKQASEVVASNSNAYAALLYHNFKIGLFQ